MATEAMRPTTAAQHYSLNKIREAAASYRLAAPDLAPGDAYRHHYALCTILQPGMFGEEGSLAVARTGGPDGGKMDFLCERRCISQHAQYISGSADCEDNALRSPRRYHFNYKLAMEADAPPFPLTGMEERGELTGGKLRLNINGQQLEREAPAPAMLKWGLFDAVQHLPQDFAGAEFTLIDEQGIVLRGQQLLPHAQAVVRMGGANIPLRAYRHIGTGVLPFVYWVGPQNRTLFAMSGQEVYILKDADGVEAEYEANLSLEQPEPAEVDA